ncbi:unnamed protein product [Closterium sp. NIES-54]
MDVWGPARVRGQGHERYFLLVVDNYSRYTTVFPLRRKGEVTEVLIDWIRGARRQLSESFGSDLPVLRLHSDRGGEFSSDLLRAFCCAEGIRHTFSTLRIRSTFSLVSPCWRPHLLCGGRGRLAMRLCSVSGDLELLSAMIPQTSCPPVPFHASFLASPLTHLGGNFTTPPRVVFCPLKTSRLTIRYLTTGPAPSGLSQVDPVKPVEVAVDSGATRGAEPTGAGPGGAEPGVAESEGAEPGGAEPERLEPWGAESRGAKLERAEPGGTEPGGAESGGVEPGGAEPERAEPWSGGAESGGAEPGGAESGGPPGLPSRREPLSLQQLREWYARHCRRYAGATGPAAGGASGAGAAGGAAGAAAVGGASGAAGGAAGAGAAGAAGPGGAGARGTGTVGGPAGVGAVGGAGAAGLGGARTGGTEAARAGGAAGVGAVGAGAVPTGGASGARAVGGTGAGGAVGVAAGDPGAEGTSAVSAVSGGDVRPRPYYVLLLQQPASPLPGPSPYSGPIGGLTERCEPESRPASPESRPESPVCPVRTGRRVPRQRPPPLPGTHSMTLRPSTAPQRVPLPFPLAFSLPALADPESDSLGTASPTVTRLLATVVTDPSFEPTAASAFVAELVNFSAHCRLDYAASLVTEPEATSVCPPSVGGEFALGTDALEDRQEEFECFAAAVPHLVSMLLAPEGDTDAPDILTPRSYAEAIEGPYSSQWQAAMDAEMASWKSTGTYVEVPPHGANIVSGMWIFRVKRPPGSPPVFKARYVARGFSQRHGVDFFQNFSPTPKMTTLRVLLHIAAQRDYELHSFDFSTAFLQGNLHEEIWPRRPPGFTGSFPTGTQWSLRRLVYGLRQAPREWHDTLRTTLATLGFAPSTADPSLFLRTETTLPPFYVLVYVDDLVFVTADTEALAHVKSELQKRHTCTDLGELTSYLGLRITRDRAQRTITLTRSHMVQQVLQRLGFTYSSPPSTPLPIGHSLSAPPLDESVEPSYPYLELVGCLMYLMTCTRPDLAYPLSLLDRYVAPGRHRKVHWDAAKRVLRYLCSTSGMGLVLGGRARVVLTGHADASWVDDLATQRSSQGYTFSLGSGSVSSRSTRLSSVLSSSCEAEIYAGAMAAQELRWLTYLLTDLGEAPRSPPVLYVDNKAMLALCQEHRLENRTKHIALRYFLARELQQRGQLRLAYVASRANTADVFTKALQPCDHQRFCTVPGLVGITVLLVDITQVAKEVDRTITIITHRYIEYGETSGGRVSNQLSRFIKDHGGENRTLVVEGIDGDGRPTSHRFELSENPIKKHKFGGTFVDYVKLCTGFAKEIVARMKFRMWDLQQMGGAKLFQVESWPSREDQREIKCLDWLAQNDELFGFMLPALIVRVAKNKKLALRYTLYQNGITKREMRTVVESVRTMLLHMGVQHHWWHLALRLAVWVRNCLERSTLPPGTTPYQVLTRKKPDFSLARVWGCMVQFLVPEQQHGGKLKPKARRGLHLGVPEESKGWELLNIAENRVVTTSDVVFYENMSLEVWKSEHGPVSGRTPTTLPTDTLTVTLPLLDEVSAFGDEGRSGTSPSASAKSIAGGRRDEQQVDVGVKLTLIGEEQADEAVVKPTTKQSATRLSIEEPTIGEKSAGKPAEVQQDDEGSEAGDDGRDAEESTESDVVEVQRGPQQSGQIWRPPDFYVLAAFTTEYGEVDDDLQYDDAEEDEDFPELDPDMHAGPEHPWDISTMTVTKAIASWKGKAVILPWRRRSVASSAWGRGSWSSARQE